jgi:hypothetical protein
LIRDISFTDRFLQHLFVVLVKRSPVPFTDRLYSRLVVANAYDALERAIAVRADALYGITTTPKAASTVIAVDLQAAEALTVR